MSKLNQLLALLLVLQGGILGLVQFSGTENTIQRPEKLFTEVDPKDATKLHIQAPLNQDSLKDNDYTYEKQNGTWVLNDAENYPAESKNLDAFLGKLAKAKSVQRVTSKKTYHNSLKVSESKFERKITMSIDGKEVLFYIGSSSGPKRSHFRFEGTDDVLLVDGLLPFDVYDASSGWLDPNFFTTKKDDVWAIDVQSKGKPRIQVERGADSKWALAGHEGVLNTTSIDAMLVKASKIILDHAIGKTDKPEFGFSDPSHLVTITTGTSTITGFLPKSYKTHRFEFGNSKQIRDSKYTYVRKTGSPWIVMLPDWAQDKLTNASIQDLIKQ